MRPIDWSLVAVLAVAACGGGGGGDRGPSSEPPAPYGLSARPNLASFDLPPAAGTGGGVVLARAWPALAFPNALFVAGVPGEGRLVVVQQSGEVRAFASDPGAAVATTVFDLSARVLFAGEQGLLGLAFDPAFVTNRFVYVHYTAPAPRRSVIARFTWNVPDAIDPASERVLLEVIQPFANHNGGMLAFGPDDYLYIAFGDGGSGGDPQNNAQTPANALGSILRIDVHPSDPRRTYDVPPDNPFVGRPGFLPETWAYGFRNPFRFSFDRATGDLWLGDVGQSALEEIDLVTAGGNYGWRVYEGNQPYDGSLNTLPVSAFTFPVFEYGRSEGLAVIGGYVYRGNAVPGLQGRYLYSDFGSGTVWALTRDGTGAVVNESLATAIEPTSFGEDNEGEVLVVSRNQGLHRFEPSTSGGPAPDLLSETGLFTDVERLVPASGLIEYGVNHPSWSDGAATRRWLAVPQPGRIAFSPTGAWGFPEGTLAVEHFAIERVAGDPASTRPLETRVLVLGPEGWRGFTWRWNEAATDAVLLTGRLTETLEIERNGNTGQQSWAYPSRTDCVRCHNDAAGGLLGTNTRQFNRPFAYPAATDNQLRTLGHIGLFDTDVGDGSAYGTLPVPDASGVPVETRARAWLDVNCSHCHRPGGPTGTDMDLRFDTRASAMNAIDVAPVAGDLGIANARIIAPGERNRSVLWQRTVALGPERMPPLSSHVVDQTGVDLVGEWIDGMP